MTTYNAPELSSQDIDVFVSAIDLYFSHSTQEKAQIKAAYLGEQILPNLDCTGAIEVGGAYIGQIYYTAPIPMLRHILAVMREPDLSMDNILDTVGEIANTIAGQSRKHFGPMLDIKPPIKTQDITPFMQHRVREHPYVIAIRWKQYQSALVIDIAPK